MPPNLFCFRNFSYLQSCHHCLNQVRWYGILAMRFRMKKSLTLYGATYKFFLTVLILLWHFNPQKFYVIKFKITWKNNSDIDNKEFLQSVDLFLLASISDQIGGFVLFCYRFHPLLPLPPEKGNKRCCYGHRSQNEYDC